MPRLTGRVGSELITVDRHAKRELLNVEGVAVVRPVEQVQISVARGEQ
jgi:hypothetical protein